MTVYPILHVDRPLTGNRRDRFDERALDAAGDWGRLYIVDRVGLEKNKPSLEVYQDLTREADLWLDVGPVGAEDVMDIMIIGADRVTVRWDRVWDEATLGEMIDLVDEGLFVGLPFREDWLTNRRTGAPVVRQIADRLAGANSGGIVLIDLDRAGTGEGFRSSRCPDPNRLDVPVWAAGGISGPREARTLRDKGFEGVLVGSAIDAFPPGEWR